MKNVKSIKKVVFVFVGCLLTINASGSQNKDAPEKDRSTYIQEKCDSLFAEDEIIEIQYRHSPSENITRTIELTTKPGTPQGVFVGRDQFNWAFEGRYSGDTFKFTMKKGEDILSGNAICTKYGAIGVKQYTNKPMGIYRIMWLKKTELTKN